ncbi:AIPR protein [Desulfocurvibacter africanus PCS]|uniref:AIPR protein n=1 Tax=Desulfocurvibacter africanus PCS TaxID=1262666 RepID=M5PZ86_DESAF|nr:AIPR family protein [Desulfocurvibacter africanus]EMG35641.1 AIPR protein [Desulfocurvibacter africanus PCS]
MRDAIISSYLDGFSADFGYNSKELSILFELFAGYCVVCHGYTDKFDVEKARIGDGGDTGIDVIAVLVNGKVCYDIAELEEFILNNNRIDVEFIFVQAKTSPSFDCSQMLNFGHGVREFFKEVSEMNYNEDIACFRNMKDFVYKNAIKFNRFNPSCSLYYVTTGKLETDSNLEATRKSVCRDLKDLNCLSNINVEYIDANQLYKMYQGITRGSIKEIEMDYYITLPEVDDVEEAILGRLNCKEFLKLICDEAGAIDKNTFSDNIRDYMGHSNVNEEISTTIQDDTKKKYFILLNNGITAVARKIKRTKNNLIIENIQIVNGCQTSNVIYENRDSITQDMHIPIKIISTTNQEIINSIIRSTNRQNQVMPEAFESLKEFHRKFEEYCKAKNREVNGNVYYERRSRQYVSDENIKPIDIMTLPNLLSVSISMFFEEPHSTHRYYGELLKANTGRIFVDGHALEPYYFAAYCLNRLTRELRKDAESKKHSIAKYYALMYVWRVLTHGEKPRLNSNQLIKSINNSFLKIVDDRSKFLELCVKGTSLFYRVAKESHVEYQNIARTRTITEQFISRIAPNDYI